MINYPLKRGLKLIICGTARGHQSARDHAFYAGRGNRFWSTLAQTGITPRKFAPEEYLLLLRHGIGLTDLVNDQSGCDKTIRFTARDFSLTDKILKLCPEILCFNGKRAAKEFLKMTDIGFGLLPSRIGSTRLFVAPSTSGSAGRWWDESVWHKLASIIPASNIREKAADVDTGAGCE